MKLASLALALLVAAAPVATYAQDGSTAADEQILLKQIQNDKRGVFARYLDLTEAQSKAFWPIYDEYEAESKKLDDRFLELINDYVAKYDTLTDAQALEMLKDRLAIDTKRNDLRVKYCGKVAKVLPGKQALRFAQLDARIRNMQMRNLYTLLPLAR
jgi:Spy/CpxP family protein refolding chaperone